MASVLLVVGNVTLSTGDQQIEDLLDGTDAASSRSDTVEVRSHSDPPANFDSYDLIVVSETVSSSTFWSNYSDLGTEAKPVIVLESGNYADFRLSASATATTTVTAYLADGTHHIAGGETEGDNETFHSGSGSNAIQDGTADIGTGADFVWAANSDQNDWRIWAYDTSASMTSGTAPARRVAFGWKDPAMAALTLIGKNVFIASVEWSLGEDDAGISGTLAETEDDDTLSASGTVTAPEVTGTLVETEEDDSLAASGSLGYSGSLAETEEDDTLSASGSVVNFIGSLAETETDDTLAADGHLAYLGSLTETEEDDSLSASGSVGGGVSGSLAETEDDDALSAAGTLGYTGSLAETEDDDTLSATGTLGYSGTLAETEESDTLSATGTSGEGTFGTLSETEENDTLDASGTSTPLEVTGTLAETEDDDSLSASGTSTGLVGTLAESEDDDTLAASGVLGYAGTVAQTEEDDSLAASGTVVNFFTGTLAVTEDDDTLFASGGFGVADFIRIESAGAVATLVNADSALEGAESAGNVHSGIEGA